VNAGKPAEAAPLFGGDAWRSLPPCPKCGRACVYDYRERRAVCEHCDLRRRPDPPRPRHY